MNDDLLTLVSTKLDVVLLSGGRSIWSKSSHYLYNVTFFGIIWPLWRDFNLQWSQGKDSLSLITHLVQCMIHWTLERRTAFLFPGPCWWCLYWLRILHFLHSDILERVLYIFGGFLVLTTANSFLWIVSSEMLQRLLHWLLSALLFWQYRTMFLSPRFCGSSSIETEVHAILWVAFSQICSFVYSYGQCQKRLRVLLSSLIVWSRVRSTRLVLRFPSVVVISTQNLVILLIQHEAGWVWFWVILVVFIEVSWRTIQVPATKQWLSH